MFAYSKIDTFLLYSFMQQYIVLFHIDLFLSKEKVIFVVGNHSILSFRLKLWRLFNPDLLVHNMYGKCVILKNFENSSKPTFILANIPRAIQFLILKMKAPTIWQNLSQKYVYRSLYSMYKWDSPTSSAQIFRENLKKINLIDCYETSN